jgi:hypothetical protein
MGVYTVSISETLSNKAVCYPWSLLNLDDLLVDVAEPIVKWVLPNLGMGNGKMFGRRHNNI